MIYDAHFHFCRHATVENRIQLIHENGAAGLLQPVDSCTAVGLPQNGGSNRRSEGSVGHRFQNGSMRVNASDAGLMFGWTASFAVCSIVNLSELHCVQFAC
jgi:hypothetical protein